MRILILMHKDAVPPEDAAKLRKTVDEAPWVTEYDVATNLTEMGHSVLNLGVIEDLRKIRSAVEEFKPHIVYNLIEEFLGEAIFDQNVVSYLELLGVPYTGCNPRGLMLARDKALAKKILTYHRIKTPKFCVFPKNRPRKLPKQLTFPLIVKCLFEEASFGIAKASIVHSEEKLRERVSFINKNLGADAIAEQFIEGREFYVAIMGNYRLKTYPVWQLNFEKADKPEKEIYSEKAKFNAKYRAKHGIDTGPAKLSDELNKRVMTTCKNAYRALNFNGYARIDLRIDSDERIYVLEGNPNPDISHDDDFALSAKHAGVSYQQLLKNILKLGKSWNPRESNA